MTATEELRRMLDERDEYYKTSGNKTWWGRPIDRQTGKPINVFHYQAQPMGEDRLFVELQLATPEQAIAATLGDTDATAERRGDAGTVTHRTTTRHGKWRTKYGRSVPCCECCGYGIGDTRWHFCPSCGAEVVE